MPITKKKPKRLMTFVRLTPETRKSLELVAMEELRTMSNVIQLAITEYLKRRGK